MDKNTGVNMCQNQWNQQIQTDRTIPKNKPDIIIRDNEKGNMYVNRRCNLRRKKCH